MLNLLCHGSRVRRRPWSFRFPKGRRRCLEPRNCRVAYSVTPSDIRQGLPCCPSGYGFFNLKPTEFRFTAEPYSPCLCSLASFICSSSDQVPFKSRQATQNSNHKLPMHCGCIGPSVSKGTELSACPANLIQDIEEIPLSIWLADQVWSPRAHRQSGA